MDLNDGDIRVVILGLYSVAVAGGRDNRFIQMRSTKSLMSSVGQHGRKQLAIAMGE